MGNRLAVPADSGAGQRAVLAGHYLEDDQGAVTVACEDPALERHADRPWTLAYVQEKYGVRLPESGTEGPGTGAGVAVSDSALEHHALLCGASGSGKTRLMQHLLAGQLPWGVSLVMLDPKKETLRRMLVAAMDAGVPPDRVTLLLPGLGGVGCPGWNPLLPSEGTTLSQAVTSFVSLLAAGSSSWGPRLQDLLTNAALLIGAQGLTLYELVRFLQMPDYRAAVLARPLPDLPLGDRIACDEAAEYFAREYGGWGEREQASAAAPVLNKVRDLLRIPFLRALFCARESTLDFRALWRGQRLLLVHLDDGSLGDDGTRLLSGLLVSQLLRTARRNPAAKDAAGREGNPVALALDELGLSERFSGKAVCDILAVAREYRLRLIAACQHMGQLSGELREALLTSTAVRFFFRLGISDARFAADALSAGQGGQLRRVVLEAAPPEYPASAGPPATDSRTGKLVKLEKVVPKESWTHPVFDGRGFLLERTETAYATVRRREPEILSCIGDDRYGIPRAALEARKLAVASGLPRLYVNRAGTRDAVEVGEYVRGLREEEVSLSGASPLSLIVHFPRPRLKRLEKASETELRQEWVRRLMDMPKQQAALWLFDGPTRLVKVIDVPDALSDPELPGFEQAALDATGITPAEVEAAYRFREAGVRDLLAQQTPGPLEGATDEGALSAPTDPPPGSGGGEEEQAPPRVRKARTRAEWMALRLQKVAARPGQFATPIPTGGKPRQKPAPRVRAKKNAAKVAPPRPEGRADPPKEGPTATPPPLPRVGEVADDGSLA